MGERHEVDDFYLLAHQPLAEAVASEASHESRRQSGELGKRGRWS
jgi:hypothetical protein